MVSKNKKQPNKSRRGKEKATVFNEFDIESVYNEIQNKGLTLVELLPLLHKSVVYLLKREMERQNEQPDIQN